jgi:hypothetical protein
MTSTNGTRSTYTIRTNPMPTEPPDGFAIPESETSSARLIIVAALLVTVAIGIALVLTTEHAADIARSSLGTLASIARSSWG